MTGPLCGAATFLRPGGPVRVPFRPCCAAALVHASQAADPVPPSCPGRPESRGADPGALFALTGPHREVVT